MTTVRTIKKVKRVGHEHLIFESQKKNFKAFFFGLEKVLVSRVSLNYIDRGIVVLTKSKVLVLSYFNSTGNISYLILIIVLFVMGERYIKVIFVKNKMGTVKGPT